MSIAQGHVSGLNFSRKGQVPVCPKASHLEDMGIFGIKVADKITV
jgi:hypothetical protein